MIDSWRFLKINLGGKIWWRVVMETNIADFETEETANLLLKRIKGNQTSNTGTKFYVYEVCGGK